MYKLTHFESILRVEDSTTIPFDEGNVDYQQYLAWLEEGNTPLPADPIIPQVPQQVTKFQGKAALLHAGLLDNVESMMQHPDTQILTKLAWTECLSFERQSEMVKSIAAQLKLSDQQIDQLFVYAAGVK